jgi:uncharacterized protein (TIGR03435 family)
MAYVLSNQSWYRGSSEASLKSKCYGVLQRLILKLASLAVLSIAFGCTGLHAQSDTPKATDKLAFDVVSIRPSTQSYVKFDYLGPGNELATHGGLFFWNVSAYFLIGFAYDVRPTKATGEALLALPDWTRKEFYVVEARAEGNPSRAEVRQMVRAMLEDRFQFKAHIEKREGSVLALTVVKQGLGLKPHAEGASCELPSSLTDKNKYPNAYPSYEMAKQHCGVFRRSLSHVNDSRLEMLDASMQQIVASLPQQIPIIDQTGLEGHYDAVLDFGPERFSPSADTSDSLGLPKLPVALEKQLGLKLVEEKAQVDVFVVDRIGTLSEN